MTNTTYITPILLIGSMFCLILYIIPLSVIYYSSLLFGLYVSERFDITNYYYNDIIISSLCGHVTRYFVKDIVIFNIFIIIIITIQLYYTTWEMIKIQFFHALIIEYLVNIINVLEHFVKKPTI